MILKDIQILYFLNAKKRRWKLGNLTYPAKTVY